MISKNKTLHLFGGGYLIRIAEEIAYKNGYNVILRTGDRFVKNLPILDSRTVLLIGDNLDSLLLDSHQPQNGDIALSISAPWIFKKFHIEMFYGRFFNIHNQPLPKFKGAGGSTWRILMKDYFGGASIHLMTEGIDDGDVIQKIEFRFSPNNVYPINFDEETKYYSSLLLGNWLENEINGWGISKTPKYDKLESEYWPRLNSEIHGWINWDWDIYSIKSFCDSFSYPQKGALTTINNIKIYIKELEVVYYKNKFHPFQNGLIFNIYEGKLFVAHKEGTLIINKFELFDSNYKIRLGDRLFTSYQTLENAMKTRVQYLPNGNVVII